MLRGLKILVMVVVACLAFTYVVEHLWNALLPVIFGLRTITFWQALGLLLLSKLLFGGFHRHSGGRGRWGRRGMKQRWDMKQRWEKMSPEERERFRAGMRRGWRGCRPAAQEDAAEKGTV